MMKPQEVKLYIPSIDKIAKEFVEFIRKKRDPKSLEVGEDFFLDIKHWALENVGWIGLNTRLNCFGENKHPDVEALVKNVIVFFDKAYDFEVLPSTWKVNPTPEFNKLMESMDLVGEISNKLIETAIAKIKQSPAQSRDEMSVVEKLIEKDEHIAKVMALELFFAGVDTVSINLNFRI